MRRGRGKAQEAPKTAEDGAAAVRALLVELFDRRDGGGADWPLMLESLFRAGFQIADGRPDDAARRSLMRRVHAGAYDRLAGNEGADTDGTALPSGSGGTGKAPVPHPPR